MATLLTRAADLGVVAVVVTLTACSGGSKTPTALSPSQISTASTTPSPTSSPTTSGTPVPALRSCLVGTWRQTLVTGTTFFNGRPDEYRQVEGGPGSFTVTLRANGTFESVDPPAEPRERIFTPQGVVTSWATGRAHGRWSATGSTLRFFASRADLHYGYAYKGRVLASGTQTNQNLTVTADCTTTSLTYESTGDPNNTIEWHGTRI